MNKILSIAAIVALVTTLSFAQEGGPKFGIRAGFNLIDFSSGIKEMDKEIDMGMSYGGGIVANIPITSFLSFNSELNFYYRTLFSFADSYQDDDEKEEWEINMNEAALSIPLMLQFTPIGGVPFYLAAGVQIDIPFLSVMHYEYSYENSYYGEQESGSEGEAFEDRASIDFGIALGLGYNITPNFGIDLRCVIGLTGAGFADEDEEYRDGEYHTIKSKDKSSFKQYGIGVTYFF